MCDLNILVKANYFLGIKLQSDLIIRGILQVASILRSKLKIEIERKFYWDPTDSFIDLIALGCPVVFFIVSWFTFFFLAHFLFAFLFIIKL